MIYVSILQEDGTDSDYFSFDSIEECMAWVVVELRTNFIISDIQLTGNNYIHVNDELYKNLYTNMRAN